MNENLYIVWNPDIFNWPQATYWNHLPSEPRPSNNNYNSNSNTELNFNTESMNQHWIDCRNARLLGF